MKAELTTQGDSSVGINGDLITIDGLWEGLVETPEDREEFRKSLSDYFADLMDEKPSVFFDDECPDCGRVKTNHAKGCPSSPDYKEPK